jgi:hypothetical protein
MLGTGRLHDEVRKPQPSPIDRIPVTGGTADFDERFGRNAKCGYLKPGNSSKGRC